MRSNDRYRQRYQKNAQSNVKKDDTVDWDFKTSNFRPNHIKYPLFLSEASRENEKDKFERFIRQLSRAMYACSLCERGCVFFQKDNLLKDPHFVPSLNYKEVAIIKYEPDVSDFDKLIDIQNRDDFYITSVIKCPKLNSDNDCPFFNLELKALEKCWFKLIIILDEKTANTFGINWDVGKIQESINGRFYCCEQNSKEFKTILKGLSNPQIRTRLLTS